MSQKFTKFFEHLRLNGSADRIKHFQLAALSRSSEIPAAYYQNVTLSCFQVSDLRMKNTTWGARCANDTISTSTKLASRVVNAGMRFPYIDDNNYGFTVILPQKWV